MENSIRKLFVNIIKLKERRFELSEIIWYNNFIN